MPISAPGGLVPEHFLPHMATMPGFHPHPFQPGQMEHFLPHVMPMPNFHPHPYQRLAPIGPYQGHTYTPEHPFGHGPHLARAHAMAAAQSAARAALLAHRAY